VLIRLWRTKLVQSRIAEFEENERNRSAPMFKQQPGCLGVLFLGTNDDCLVLSFWKDRNSVDALASSPSYRAVVDFYSSSGMLIGTPTLDVFELKSGFLDSEIQF
jgi:heme-degrading monooxygenase HmoA